MKIPKRFKWTLQVTVEVDEIWVADGFEASPERIGNYLQDYLLDYAHEWEKKVTVKTLKAPTDFLVKAAQGYGHADGCPYMREEGPCSCPIPSSPEVARS